MPEIKSKLPLAKSSQIPIKQVMWCHEAACNKDSGKSGNVPGSNTCFPSATVSPAAPVGARHTHGSGHLLSRHHRGCIGDLSGIGSGGSRATSGFEEHHESYCFLLLLTCKMELICLILMQPVLLGNAKLKVRAL